MEACDAGRHSDVVYQHVVGGRERHQTAEGEAKRNDSERYYRRQERRSTLDSEKGAELFCEDPYEQGGYEALHNGGFYPGLHDSPDQPMVPLSDVGSDQRLQRHAHAVHNDGELDQVDDHGEGGQGRLPIVV